MTRSIVARGIPMLVVLGLQALIAGRSLSQETTDECSGEGGIFAWYPKAYNDGGGAYVLLTEDLAAYYGHSTNQLYVFSTSDDETFHTLVSAIGSAKQYFVKAHGTDQGFTFAGYSTTTARNNARTLILQQYPQLVFETHIDYTFVPEGPYGIKITAEGIRELIVPSLPYDYFGGLFYCSSVRDYENDCAWEPKAESYVIGWDKEVPTLHNNATICDVLDAFTCLAFETVGVENDAMSVAAYAKSKAEQAGRMVPVSHGPSNGINVYNRPICGLSCEITATRWLFGRLAGSMLEFVGSGATKQSRFEVRGFVGSSGRPETLKGDVSIVRLSNDHFLARFAIEPLGLGKYDRFNIVETDGIGRRTPSEWVRRSESCSQTDWDDLIRAVSQPDPDDLVETRHGATREIPQPVSPGAPRQGVDPADVLVFIPYDVANSEPDLAPAIVSHYESMVSWTDTPRPVAAKVSVGYGVAPDMDDVADEAYLLRADNVSHNATEDPGTFPEDPLIVIVTDEGNSNSGFRVAKTSWSDSQHVCDNGGGGNCYGWYIDEDGDAREDFPLEVIPSGDLDAVAALLDQVSEWNDGSAVDATMRAVAVVDDDVAGAVCEWPQAAGYRIEGSYNASGSSASVFLESDYAEADVEDCYSAVASAINAGLGELFVFGRRTHLNLWTRFLVAGLLNGLDLSDLDTRQTITIFAPGCQTVSEYHVSHVQRLYRSFLFENATGTAAAAVVGQVNGAATALHYRFLEEILYEKANADAGEPLALAMWRIRRRMADQDNDEHDLFRDYARGITTFSAGAAMKANITVLQTPSSSPPIGRDDVRVIAVLQSGIVIRTSVGRGGRATAEVFDVSGRRCAVTDLGVVRAGRLERVVRIPATMAPGVYFLRLDVVGDRIPRRMATQFVVLE